jgi:hypothetical protein
VQEPVPTVQWEEHPEEEFGEDAGRIGWFRRIGALAGYTLIVVSLGALTAAVLVTVVVAVAALFDAAP